MKRLILLPVLFFGLWVRGQMYDAQWALGYNESVLDFRTVDSVKIDSLPTLEYFTFTNASICDPVGNLRYYTNGVSICSASDTLLNGSGLSPCSYTTQYAASGLNIPQAAIFIPMPGNNRFYYLFHFSNDINDTLRPGTVYYSLIDNDGNSGKGEVIAKNIPVLQYEILREGGMTACKHANGRDYWLVVEGYNNNTFYKILITPDGVQSPRSQSIGPVFPRPYDIAYSKFSQDGSKFVTGIWAEAPALLLNFDRCSGIFSNPDTIFNNIAPDSSTPISGCASLEFSPSGRFLYIATSQNLRQYDLSSSNIQDSMQLYTVTANDSYWIKFLQLSMNGKLYGSTWGGGLAALHVINYPDLKGDSAGFVYGGQPTFTINSINLPNLINYKLGPLTGSGCDTINTGVTETQSQNLRPRIIPNPANKYAYIEMGSQGNYQFELLNEAGQVVDRKETKQVDIFDTEHLSSGVYVLRVIDKTTGAELTAKKVVVVH